MKAFKIYMALMSLTLLAPGLTSCVHQWPDPGGMGHNVALHVHCDTDWIPDYVMDYTREAGDDVKIGYQFKVYPAGHHEFPVSEFSVYSYDMKRGDFTTMLTLPPGNYDIWAWSDICDAETGQSLFYDSSDFGDITYLKPYRGDTDRRDAFRGMTSFSVESSYDEGPDVEAWINLERPLARFIFIATDLADFIDREVSRGRTIRYSETQSGQMNASPQYALLNGYTVRISYPLYMPAVFDNFINNPIDSWTGISFTGEMQQLSDSEAQLGMDYTMVNGEDSAVQVMMEVYDPDGVLIARTGVIDVPTKRDRTTIIRGKFLTTLESGGVSINPDFDGDFNIDLGGN